MDILKCFISKQQSGRFVYVNAEVGADKPEPKGEKAKEVPKDKDQVQQEAETALRSSEDKLIAFIEKSDKVKLKKEVDTIMEYHLGNGLPIQNIVKDIVAGQLTLGNVQIVELKKLGDADVMTDFLRLTAANVKLARELKKKPGEQQAEVLVATTADINKILKVA